MHCKSIASPDSSSTPVLRYMVVRVAMVLPEFLVKYGYMV